MKPTPHQYQAIEPDRRRMPDTRSSMTHCIKHVGQLKIYIIVGFYDNGDPGELFIKIGKEGSTLAGIMDILGVLISQMMQYNIPWDRIARNLYHTNFEPLNLEGNSIAHVIVTETTRLIKERKEAFEREMGQTTGPDVSRMD